MTVSDTPSGGYYSLTIDLQVPGMSIDHQEVITQAFADTETTLQLLAIGPTSPDGEEHPSYLNLETLYIVAASGLPRTCRGPVPQSSEVARDSTLHLSHAGIYKAVSGSAAQMHNEFKDAT
jgi:hypothetical protein